ALRGGESKLHSGYDFPGALTGTHVADGEFAWVTPVAVKRGIDVMRGNGRQIVQHRLQILLADAGAEILECLAAIAFFDISLGQAGHDFGNSLAGNCADRERIT